MPSSSSEQAYPDIKLIMEKALEAPNGIQIPFASRKECRSFKMRCYHFRAQERKTSARIYPVGAPGYGISDFDSLSLIDSELEGQPAVTIRAGVFPSDLKVYDPTTGKEL